jgi:hypothetical protein
MTTHRARRRRVAALVLGVVAALVIPAAPAWAPACGPFRFDVQDSAQVWIGTIVAVHDVSSDFSGANLGRPVFRLTIDVQEVLKGASVTGLQAVYENSGPSSASAFLGLQTMFAPSGRHPEGTRWDVLLCRMSTPVGELRNEAAAVLGLPPSSVPPPAEVLSASHFRWVLSLVVGATVVVLLLALFAYGRRRHRSRTVVPESH